jgi:hypothetical protein
MIKTKLLEIEYKSINQTKIHPEKLVAILRIKQLLSEIDFNSEIVPLHDEAHLLKLLTSLKNEKLSKYELLIAKELVNSANEN